MPKIMSFEDVRSQT